VPQLGKNVIVAFKVEATQNTAPGTGSAEQLRITPSAGLGLRKEGIRSAESRSDLLTSIVRHGSQMVDGSYSGEMSVGSFDTIFQAVMRSTASTLVITGATASLASITFGTNTITATNTSTGSGFLQAGIRVGDVFRITGSVAGSAANNNINARVGAVATHTITMLGTSVFTATTTADTTFTMTRGKKLVNGSTATRRTFYVQEHNSDITLSEVFGGCRFTSMRLRGSPNGMADVEFGVMGMSSTALATAASPYYVSPTQYTSQPLVFADANIAFGGSDIAVATAFELNLEINAATLPVIGSTTTPDVFDNDARISGTITVLRESLTNLSRYINETELELHVLMKEPGSVPQAYISVFVPRIKLMGVDAPIGGDGAMTETLRWEGGAKVAATGYDGTLLVIETSNGA